MIPSGRFRCGFWAVAVAHLGCSRLPARRVATIALARQRSSRSGARKRGSACSASQRSSSATGIRIRARPGQRAARPGRGLRGSQRLRRAPARPRPWRGRGGEPIAWAALACPQGRPVAGVLEGPHPVNLRRARLATCREPGSAVSPPRAPLGEGRASICGSSRAVVLIAANDVAIGGGVSVAQLEQVPECVVDRADLLVFGQQVGLGSFAAFLGCGLGPCGTKACPFAVALQQLGGSLLGFMGFDQLRMVSLGHFSKSRLCSSSSPRER